LQHRLSQAVEAKNTLARASSIKNIFNSMYIFTIIIIVIFFYKIVIKLFLFKENVINEKSVRTSLTNITNAFEDM